MYDCAKKRGSSQLAMAVPHLITLIVLIFLSETPLISSSYASFSSPPFGLKLGSSLSVADFLISPNAIYTAGFYSVGENAYCFSIWFTKPLADGSLTILWMANRDLPVNGRFSKLSLLKTGNLVLKDAYQRLPIWTTNTRDSKASAYLKLNNSGNLCLRNKDGEILWQSFDTPTDTLLPNQPLTKDAPLVSSRSVSNYSSGFYKLFFDNDNVVRLVYSDSKLTGIFWPNPELRAWESGRNTYGSRRIGIMDSSGRFISTDDLVFNTSDAGDGIQPLRRLTMDVDGNFRAYSLDETRGIWRVTWQALSETCKIHGSCGENSTCSNDPVYGRKCTCLPNHTMINRTDWSYGCKPEFKPTLCGNGDDQFLHLPHSDFWGYDTRYMPNTTLNECKQECRKICNCKGFQFKYDWNKGFSICYPKFLLVNGLRSSNFNGSIYLKLPKDTIPIPSKNNHLNCSSKPTIQLDRTYDINHQNESTEFLMRIITCVFGAIEIIFITYFFYGTHAHTTTTTQGYNLQVASGFKRFSYAQLKKASRNFRNEIGRGGGGVVYKGVLNDNRIVAIKRLNESSNKQGEAELLAEVTTLGKLNHMNLIEMWGYCAEGKHRLLVYEFMDNGSLAMNLNSSTLNWDQRFEIALGTAKGLAYLHEECLEWVLHCDVKPHNILLDSNYRPKVGDFGLSKLLDRDGGRDLEFTRARGTRGYMAPEWYFVNLPITSKVDVYSYGVVMLEMVTGRSPTCGGLEGRMDRWVADKMGGENDGWVKGIVDSKVVGEYDVRRMEILIKVALRCCDEDKDLRPTMSQVVDMLLHVE
ncbi:hypothetical protein LXL04_014569 [Taraxacum kok-saghyz]